MGPVEKAVRDDVGELGDLVGVEPSLSEVAYALAHEIDVVTSGECESCGEAVPTDSGKSLPALSKELRATLAQLLEGRAPDDDDELGDLAAPD